MTNYRRDKVIRKLVSYIEKYHPEVLFMVRPEDTVENREIGIRPGSPDILILERRGRYMGLAMWVTSATVKSEKRYKARFINSGYDTEVSNDPDCLHLSLITYLSKPPDTGRAYDTNQLRFIRSQNSCGVRGYHPPEREPLDRDTVRCVVEYVRGEYRDAAVIPLPGFTHGPDIIIISPNSLHDGMAIWLSKTDRCYSFFTLTDRQLGCLKKMAKRSYITIASSDYQDITDIIDDYMVAEYEHGDLPKFCDEDCP